MEILQNCSYFAKHQTHRFCSIMMIQWTSFLRERKKRVCVCVWISDINGKVVLSLCKWNGHIYNTKFDFYSIFTKLGWEIIQFDDRMIDITYGTNSNKWLASASNVSAVNFVFDKRALYRENSFESSPNWWNRMTNKLHTLYNRK